MIHPLIAKVEDVVAGWQFRREIARLKAKADSQICVDVYTGIDMDKLAEDYYTVPNDEQCLFCTDGAVFEVVGRFPGQTYFVCNGHIDDYRDQ